MDMCLNMISNAVESGHKILLFSQFTTMLDHLAKRLEEEKISYYMLTGSTSKEKRAQMVENFNTDDTQVFCISLKAGGTGLNLTAADIVIHFDPWWNLAVQNQATDRAHIFISIASFRVLVTAYHPRRKPTSHTIKRIYRTKKFFVILYCFSPAFHQTIQGRTSSTSSGSLILLCTW